MRGGPDNNDPITKATYTGGGKSVAYALSGPASFIHASKR